MRKVLIYVGANKGDSLIAHINKFDQIIAFEPDPRTFLLLHKRFSAVRNVKCFPFACGSADGVAPLQVHVNRVSSSLGILPAADYQVGNFEQSIQVPVINLKDFLKFLGINEIDTYISDAQGSDLLILTTLKALIDGCSIKNLVLETHWDGPPIYGGLDNSLKGFQLLLQDKYSLEKIFLGSRETFIYPFELPMYEKEFDTFWRVI
jgi:FkbM family methyltransferase